MTLRTVLLSIQVRQLCSCYDCNLTVLDFRRIMECMVYCHVAVFTSFMCLIVVFQETFYY